MPTSDLWRDLSEQFFRARIHSRSQAKSVFESLARRGASWFDPPPTGDLFAAWIEALRKRNEGIPLPRNAQALCELATDFCNAMEREALEREQRTQEIGASEPDLSERVRALEERLEGTRDDPSFAKIQAAPTHVRSRQDITGALAQSDTGTIAEGANNSDRRERINSFLGACNRLSQARVYRRHIWLAIEHTSARQFQYWQAFSSKATGEDNRNFSRILAMTPADFIELLQRKKLLHQHS